ncbi:MAG: GNAT family N-acetyltransferase [archaeon]
MDGLSDIREMAGGDIDDVSRLVGKCIEVCSRDVYNDDERRYWVSLYSGENFMKYTEGWKFFVLSLEGRVVGCAGLNRDEVKGMFVDPKFQGKKLGKKLLDFLENCARESGVFKLVLDSSLNGVGFYRRNGYVFVEDRVYETGLQGGCIRVVRMSKVL